MCAQTGARNEDSVLFSLAALRPSAPEAPPPPTSAIAGDPSSLIDLRALAATLATTDAERNPRSPIDDILNLGGGGVFAPVADAPSPSEGSAAQRRGERRVVLGAVAAISLLAGGVAVAAVAAGARARDRPGERDDAAALTTPASSPPPDVPSGNVEPAAAAAAAAPTASIASSPPPSSHGPRARPGLDVRGGSAAIASSTTPSAPTPSPSTTSAAPSRCCAGETEWACHLRVAAGVSCAEARGVAPSSTSATVSPFDRAAAARALGVGVTTCERPGDPSGPGHARVTFAPSGHVTAVDVDPPYAGTAAGACVRDRFRAATVPAFAGAPLTVGKTFTLP